MSQVQGDMGDTVRPSGNGCVMRMENSMAECSLCLTIAPGWNTPVSAVLSVEEGTGVLPRRLRGFGAGGKTLQVA